MDKNRSQNKKNRVVITGVGMTCAIGKNISEVTESLIHGNGGIRRITLFDSEKLHTDLFGELQDILFTGKEILQNHPGLRRL